VNIKFRSAAKAGIIMSVTFYEKKQAGLGRKFSDAMKDKLKFIADNPLAAEIRYLSVRVAHGKNVSVYNPLPSRK